MLDPIALELHSGTSGFSVAPRPEVIAEVDTGALLRAQEALDAARAEALDPRARVLHLAQLPILHNPRVEATEHTHGIVGGPARAAELAVSRLSRIESSEQCSAEQSSAGDRVYAGSRVMGRPVRGLRVIRGSASIVCPGASAGQKRCSKVARISLVSIIAKALPMHTRGPALKGR